MHPSSTHLPDTPYKKIKQSKTEIKSKQTKTKTKQTRPLLLHLFYLFICLSSIGSLSVSHGIYFCPVSFNCKYSLQCIFGLVQGLWFLIHHPACILTTAPLGCLSAALSLRDPVDVVA